ncbi:STAS/SEC14 domain-containing protein [Novosphingobium panipatense]
MKGEVDTPYAQAVRRIPGDDDICAFEVDGRITADELDGLYTHIFEVSQPDSPLKILVRMKRYDGFAPAILADPKIVERKLSLLHRVSRYAIVGGPDWLATLVKLSILCSGSSCVISHWIARMPHAPGCQRVVTRGDRTGHAERTARVARCGDQHRQCPDHDPDRRTASV